MKKILGLDLGTNSIGWALINQDINNQQGEILGAGSRILPMSQDILGKFDSGVSISQTAERTNFRGIRRLRERHLLRRERLHRVLNILGFLPEHYSRKIDFEKRLGQFISETEPKIAYSYNSQTQKFDFFFKTSFEEMLNDFKKHQPQLLINKKGEPALVPYDWTIYYLRKKALTHKIEKEELAWLLLNFNQKRGYYHLRGEEEEENDNKLVEFYTLLVTGVEDSGDRKNKDEIWYNIHLENGWIYRRTSKTPLDWVGKIKEFIVTTDLNEDGTVKKNKEGEEKRSFRAPAENDWTLVKKKTEYDINTSNKAVGAYIYDTLLQNPNQKIKGKLVRVIERKFYKQELKQILETQQAFHNELKDIKLYNACIEELYENNESHRNNISERDFVHLFLNDIIFYQRPLKSKKSLVSNCKFETRTYIKNGKKEIEPLKCIAKSHPLFQEFRLWQFIQNLKIYQREKHVNGVLLTDVNVTNDYLTNEEAITDLYDWLNDRKEVDQKALLKYFKIKNVHDYRWNYVEDKLYPCNETRAQIANRLSKVPNIPPSFLSRENEEALWHILYSVEDKEDIQKALKSFTTKHQLDEQFATQFSKFPPFKKEYGSYSTKAIKKLLPLMRKGKYWSAPNISQQTQGRISNLINGEFDETIKDRVREKAIHLNNLQDFKGLPHWLVSYIVYDRHSEDGDNRQWKTANEITLLEQHSLRNPIVEQVINETLQVVRDIWKTYGNADERLFDEIHIELGREMKAPKSDRERMTKQITENENTNLRIKALLIELLNDKDIENVRPFSPMQQEILKIYEEGVLSAEDGNIPDEILKIAKMAQPTPSELIRYKLWLQQKYRSPYTGNIIPLNKLFTREYDIEHIIPQSRYFDDSLSNKVICEVEVNKDKDNATAYEYIKNNRGKKIELSHGKVATIFTVEEFEEFVKTHYNKSRGKMKKLLMDDIPETFIQRQLNDSRYISKVVKSLMSNIVREDDEQDAISKNVLTSNGIITSTLKQDWGLNDIWNEVITPRFERLNKLTSSQNFGEWVNKEGKKVFQTQVPIELQKGFSKKRIDHRHHALDAIVIACASRNHINYLNNESALGSEKKEVKEKKRYDLKHKLCFKKYNDDAKTNYKWVFHKPWDTFTQDTRESIGSIIVSFKQNLRVINKTINQYQSWVKDENGNHIKKLIKQTKGENWAIRKSLHKDTISGLVNLKFKKTVSFSQALDTWKYITDKSLRSKVKELITNGYDKRMIQKFFKEKENTWDARDISKVEVYYFDNDNVASRVKIDESFNRKKIESITDTGIQKIMRTHLEKFDEYKNGKLTEHPELAFSPDGLDELNKNILELNNGKPHQPIYKVRIFEPKGNKFNVGQSGNKRNKYVEAAKGTNLFFAVYENEAGKRSYETVPLNIIIERQKQKLPPVPEVKEESKLLFYLSPNDLVYVQDKDTPALPALIDNSFEDEDLKRIYKIVSFTGNRLYAIPYPIATSIVDKVEFTQLNKMEFSLEKQSFKENAIKIIVDRIGKLKEVNGRRIHSISPDAQTIPIELYT